MFQGFYWCFHCLSILLWFSLLLQCFWLNFMPSAVLHTFGKMKLCCTLLYIIHPECK
jgi:hypothetical protein